MVSEEEDPSEPVATEEALLSTQEKVINSIDKRNSIASIGKRADNQEVCDRNSTRESVTTIDCRNGETDNKQLEVSGNEPENFNDNETFQELTEADEFIGNGILPDFTLAEQEDPWTTAVLLAEQVEKAVETSKKLSVQAEEALATSIKLSAQVEQARIKLNTINTQKQKPISDGTAKADGVQDSTGEIEIADPITIKDATLQETASLDEKQAEEARNVEKLSELEKNARITSIRLLAQANVARSTSILLNQITDVSKSHTKSFSSLTDAAQNTSKELQQLVLGVWEQDITKTNETTELQDPGEMTPTASILLSTEEVEKKNTFPLSGHDEQADEESIKLSALAEEAMAASTEVSAPTAPDEARTTSSSLAVPVDNETVKEGTSANGMVETKDASEHVDESAPVVQPEVAPTSSIRLSTPAEEAMDASAEVSAPAEEARTASSSLAVPVDAETAKERDPADSIVQTKDASEHADEAAPSVQPEVAPTASIRLSTPAEEAMVVSSELSAPAEEARTTSKRLSVPVETAKEGASTIVEPQDAPQHVDEAAPLVQPEVAPTASIRLSTQEEQARSTLIRFIRLSEQAAQVRIKSLRLSTPAEEALVVSSEMSAPAEEACTASTSLAVPVDTETAKEGDPADSIVQTKDTSEHVDDAAPAVQPEVAPTSSIRLSTPAEEAMAASSEMLAPAEEVRTTSIRSSVPVDTAEEGASTDDIVDTKDSTGHVEEALPSLQPEVAPTDSIRLSTPAEEAIRGVSSEVSALTQEAVKERISPSASDFMDSSSFVEQTKLQLSTRIESVKQSLSGIASVPVLKTDAFKQKVDNVDTDCSRPEELPSCAKTARAKSDGDMVESEGGIEFSIDDSDDSADECNEGEERHQELKAFTLQQQILIQDDDETGCPCFPETKAFLEVESNCEGLDDTIDNAIENQYNG